ncbi:MAG: helix-turn-helix domain-containing protein [Tagaea sp.]|nr:helix-turn-helix domain-containing protein [Tagaea sp.]
MLLRHADIWQAIDDLARDHGYSVSGLALRAGLDPTTFNRSKRTSPEGRPRYPSLESLSKILDAVGVRPLDFFVFSGSKASESKPTPVRTLPVMSIRQASEREPFDALGHPKGRSWDDLPFPDLNDRYAYGLTVTGDSAEPIYRDGDLLVVSPRAALKRGDRAVFRTISGRMRACEFLRKTPTRFELRPFGDEARDYETREVLFAHRIVYASQ